MFIVSLIYWYTDLLIFLTLLEITGDFHIGIYFYCIYIIHIHTTSTFLDLHFISSHWTVTFDFANSFVYTMSFHLQLNFLPNITKRWWYCRCRLFKSEKWCHPLKNDYPWEELNPHCSNLFAFKYLDYKSTSQQSATHHCTRLQVVKDSIASGSLGIFSFMIMIFNNFLCYTNLILIYDVLSSFRIYYFHSKKVKILWRLGAEDWVWRPGAGGQVTQTLCYNYSFLKYQTTYFGISKHH